MSAQGQDAAHGLRIAPARQRAKKGASERLISMGSIAVLILGWHLFSISGWVSPFFMPSPMSVLGNLYDLTINVFSDFERSIFYHIGASMWRVVAGYLLAVLLAIPVGMGVGLSRTTYHLVDPWIEIIRPLPPITWIPMAILWLGLFEPPKIALICYGAFFPIALNTISGFRGIDRVHIWAAQALGANKRQIFWNVMVRGAMTRIVVGLRLGAGMAFIVLVAAELILAYAGLGYLIQNGREQMKTDQIFVGLVVIGILGFFINKGVLWGESKIIKYRQEI